MRQPETPENESDRLVALDRYKILDTLPESVYDDLVQLAADICGMPIAMISLIDKDRQWFKSRIGLEKTETPRNISFCGHTIITNEMLYVPDASQDLRFADNPLVVQAPNIRFYAGVPLVTEDNFVLGTLCVIDTEPNSLSDQQINRLKSLGRLAINQLELRLKENTLNERTAELQQAITELKQENQERIEIEESLRASRDQFQQQQEFFRLVIYSIPSLIFVKDWDGRYLLANQTMAKFHNTTVENLVGKTDADFHINTLEAARFLEENRQIIASQQEMILPEERISHPTLGYQWLQWQKHPIKISDNTKGVLGVGVNITARKQIETSLSESQKRFESLAVVAPVGIFRTNVNGEGIYLNDRWCQIAGMTAAEAMGSNWARALHPDDREKVATEWYASVQERRPFKMECRFQNKEGLTTWVLSQSAAEFNIDGEITGYVGTITDISDRKRAETILQKLVAGTATVTGADFFVELVRHIAEALDIAYALVTELVDKQLVSLGFWANGNLHPAISYLPAKTPCELCMQEGQYHCEESVQAIFAEDIDLVTMQAESYLGISLKDDQGKAIGNLCILDTKPMSETKRAEAIDILQVFAARAAAELQRKNINEALNHLNHELEVRVQERTQELQERERFLQTVLDSFPLAVFWKDRQSILLGSNQLFAQASGLASPLDIIGKSSFDFSFTEEEARKYVEDDRSVMESGLPKIGIEETITLANGDINWIETNKIPLRDALGEVVGLVGTFQDINDRKRAEQTLAESEAFNRQLVTEFPIGLASCRLDGHLVFVNTIFAQILGRTVEEVLSLSYWDITPSKYAEQEAEQLRLIQTEGRYGPYEKEYIHKDGHLVPVLLSGIMILSNGEFLIWSSVQDISDRKQAEAQLQLANEELMRATRLKNEFLANMSHELRTPLNAILGMIEGIQDEVFGIVNERQLNALNTAEKSASHLLTLINDILDVAKIESGNIELNISQVVVGQLCSSSLAFVKQQALKKRIQLQTQIPPHLPQLLIDETRMRQVLLNLLTNAVKFTLEGGTVTLTVSLLPPEQNASQSSYMRIAVTDTGIGIAPENITKLFKPFVQIDSALNRKYTGTGLGLALVKQIVEIHGGQVGLTSELGVGSCFTIDLPYEIDMLPSDPPINLPVATRSNLSYPDNLPTESPLILLAEDNPANVATISAYLEAKGYRLVLANDGQEAIDLAISQHPNIILMDVQMPGMDGLEAMRRIRQQVSLHNIPILALTALAMKGDREICLAAGANEYMSKPIKLKQLDLCIKELLAAHSLE